MTDLISDRLSLAPTGPGVYLFKDASGEVIYVGKAANLRNRVRSYFRSNTGQSTKVLRLVSVTTDIEFVQSSSEQEALVLEADLIRRYRPVYNARLKDDKSFPFLKIDVDSEWPTVTVTRRRRNDGAVYFGPFASARSMRQTLRQIRKVFRFRVCSGPLDGARSRACLNMDIGLCPGPCVGAVSHDDYRLTIRQIVLFLRGKHREVLDSMVREMKDASKQMDFERAALLRDRIQAIDEVTRRHEGVTALTGDQDILAVAQDANAALVEVFSVREGRVLGRQDFPIEGASDIPASEVLRSFMMAYYGSSGSIPPLVLLQHPVTDAALIREWLSERRASPVRMVVPRQGARKQLVHAVADSVSGQLAAMHSAATHGVPMRDAALVQLKEVLKLTALPRRIEGFDISTTGGTEAVGSMVVFENGVPRPSQYRRFKIRGIEGQDDYAMLREVLRRRFARMHMEGSFSQQGTVKWAATPSLILVDGGRGHLAAAVAAREESKARRVPLISLAKEHEYVYGERQTQPLPLEPSSAGSLLLQSVRDEAHRFAVTYHRQLRSSSLMASVLDEIPGIGPRRRRALLLAFESLDAINAASPQEISRRTGIPFALAERIREVRPASA